MINNEINTIYNNLSNELSDISNESVDICIICLENIQ